MKLSRVWPVRAASHVWRNRRYLTPLKLANMAAVNLQLLTRSRRVWGRPYDIIVEPTNICNTQCQLCPTGEGREGRSKGVMTWERYTAIVDSSARWVYTLSLSMWGGPLISKDIYRMIRYAHEKSIWTNLSSNLHALNISRGDHIALVESGLDSLICSLHGATQNAFELYQPGKNFHSTVEKIRRIREAQDERKQSTPRIFLNFVVNRHNEHEIPDFQKLASDLKCTAVISKPSLNLRFLAAANSDSGGQDAEVLRRMDRWLPANPDYVLEPYRQIREGRAKLADFATGRKVMTCDWLWKKTVFNWDGTVSPCCGSWHRSEEFGNTAAVPFHKIWNGETYRTARQTFGPNNSGQTPCGTCPGGML